MSQLLPYLFLGLLLLAVLALWIWGAIRHRGAAEVLAPREHRSSVRSVGSQQDLGERIFGQEDWDLVSREAPLEIQRIFQRERTLLAIAWLRRTRVRISQVMRAHVTAARQSEDLQLATEMKLALSYVLFLIQCNFLIGLTWLRGPVRTRRIVKQTFDRAARLRAAFERLIAIVDPANRRAIETGFNQGTAKS